ncbi:MAG: hypothetical protein JW751_32455 [Polyangiaceae bacterium]|nr:hypothetical protein [Polyangiaceae bacterium]
MADLRLIHRYMTDRCQVVLDDGRVGKIVRVDTTFPAHTSVVSIWTADAEDPLVTKVAIERVVGTVPPVGRS